MGARQVVQSVVSPYVDRLSCPPGMTWDALQLGEPVGPRPGCRSDNPVGVEWGPPGYAKDMRCVLQSLEGVGCVRQIRDRWLPLWTSLDPRF